MPSFAEPNTRIWIYALSAAGNLTLPKRCRPYAETATRTDSRSLAEMEARLASETSLTARKYSGSCSGGVRRHEEGASAKRTVVVAAELDQLLLYRPKDRIECIDGCLLRSMRFVQLYSVFSCHDACRGSVKCCGLSIKPVWVE